ncbi:hypothetical protein [Bacillus xiapuensis]|uniref:Uncharacterized protein n=1 Tax=Bacillus xiapuensis TaxID=2014075 RepID=A0ABU6NDR8_9BACI|nr:hypothetical protein [Bacillus xiapuensis]
MFTNVNAKDIIRVTRRTSEERTSSLKEKNRMFQHPILKNF